MASQSTIGTYAGKTLRLSGLGPIHRIKIFLRRVWGDEHGFPRERNEGAVQWHAPAPPTQTTRRDEREMKRTALLIVGFIGVAALSFASSWLAHKHTAPLETVTQYVDRIVEKEVIKEIPVELRQFNSVEELQAWLLQDDSDSVEYFYETTVLPYDCEDYAIALMRNARRDGFEISLYVKEQHMMNCAIVNNQLWRIEPQDDSIVLWGKVD